MNPSCTVDEVRNFWENNPLWSGESSFVPGTREFFEEHRQTIIQDNLAGAFDERFLPPPDKRRRVLDLGCGPGFWTIEFAKYGCKNVVSADLTEQALRLTEKRCALYGLPCETSQQNAESLTFPSESFSHVNCQGVIHHTPDTLACVREIHRVLEKDGTANISVYYKNVFLQAWPLLRFPMKLLGKLAPQMKGRGRETIAKVGDINELVRLYDGAENPLGKAYSQREFFSLLEPYFEITDTFFHLFPARTLPIRIPKSLHRWLDKNFGFMIIVSLKKRL